MFSSCRDKDSAIIFTTACITLSPLELERATARTANAAGTTGRKELEIINYGDPSDD
jgi:hypothetical protein